MKLIGIARTSLEELLQDYEDFLRQRALKLWDKNDPKVLEIRNIGKEKNRTYKSYKTYIEQSSEEIAANTIIS